MGNRFTFYSRLLYGILIMPVVFLMPRMRRKMVFGAWFGNTFSDNPKYFFRYMLSKSGWECIWVGDAHLKNEVEAINGARFARRGSLLAFWHCLTAKYFVNNIIWMDDIMAVPTCRRVVQINLWHGTALKRIGGRQYNGHGESCKEVDSRSWLRRVISDAMVEVYNFLYPMSAYGTSGSEKNANVLIKSWPQIFARDRLVCAGQPRCDFLVLNCNNVDFVRKLKHHIAELIGVPENKKWYLYLPTWRHDPQKYFSFVNSGMRSAYECVLKNGDAVIIEKQHPKVLAENPSLGGSVSPFFVISPEKAKMLDVQELLLASDRLITDYSSCYFDFELLNRPIVHFDYDYEEYVNSDSGVEYEPTSVAGGPVVHTEDELCRNLGLSDAALLSGKGSRADSLIDCETGNSCDALYKLITK